MGSATTFIDRSDLDAALLPEDEKAQAAVGRYRLERITTPDEPAFADAYGALQAEFAPRREIERREVVERWLRGEVQCGLPWRYYLLAARDDSGALAGARDCHVTVDVERGQCVVYLAHTLVLPSHRRTGLATLLRAAPIVLGRRALAELAPDAATAELLLAAEMEPYDPSAADTAVRLVAYGRAGFAALSQRALPYCQPDFRDPAVIDATGGPQPVPLLAVVRRLGLEREGSLPRALAAAYVRHLYEVFATHCAPQHLEGPRAHALDALAEADADVPLLPLPMSTADTLRLTPLSRAAVLPFHMAELRGASS